MSKTLIITTIAMLAAFATPVIAADRQASDEAANNALSWQMTRGAGGAVYASAVSPRTIKGAYASARMSEVHLTPTYDRQLQYRN
jgi:opacity protein-like surface antigen